LKLTVFVDQVFWFDGDRYSTDEAFTKFVTSFAPYFDKIVFCGRLSNERKREKYVLDPNKIDVCGLPYYTDIYALPKNGIRVMRDVWRTLNREIANWDVVWICVPHPLAIVLIFLCRRTRTNYFMMVRENLRKQVTYRSSGVKKIAAMLVAAVLEKWTMLLAGQHVLFAVGGEMYRVLRGSKTNVFEVNVSLISESEFNTARVNRTLSRPAIGSGHILSVGRLDPEKGLATLVDALKILSDTHTDKQRWMLHIAGSGQDESRLRNLVKTHGLEPQVTFHGYVEHGKQLYELYEKAAVFALHSFTEGLPQVLLEAMAHGVPVVTANVGGIPFLIEHETNGLLIEPGNPQELAEALARVVDDEELRERIVSGGYETVCTQTTEANRKRMLVALREAKIFSAQELGTS